MMRLLTYMAILFITGFCANAQTVVSANAIRAKSIISAHDIALMDGDIAGGFADPDLVIGMEAKVNLYPGRPIMFSDIGPPAILERNQLVVMVYNNGALSITVEGRVMERGGVGEMIKVMNLSSKMTVIGRIMANGTVEVGL